MWFAAKKTAHEHDASPAIAPSAQEAAFARGLWQFLSRYQRSNAQVRQRVTDGEQAEPIELPAGAVALLMDILEAMAAGQGVAIFSENAEPTVVQAADVLKWQPPPNSYCRPLLSGSADCPASEAGWATLR